MRSRCETTRIRAQFDPPCSFSGFRNGARGRRLSVLRRCARKLRRSRWDKARRFRANREVSFARSWSFPPFSRQEGKRYRLSKQRAFPSPRHPLAKLRFARSFCIYGRSSKKRSFRVLAERKTISWAGKKRGYYMPLS